jgi:dienelactone hydrolase
MATMTQFSEYEVDHYTTTIAAEDPVDIYFPILSSSSEDTVEFPIALMLQGAFVDKTEYVNYASEVASYGFVVVVPNNERTLVAPTGESITGLLSEQQQVNDVLAQMLLEDTDPLSPAFEIVDTDKLGLLGHSFGGAAGLGAIQEDICLFEFCSEDYTRPPELMAGIFYAASFRDSFTNAALPINNDDIPTGLIVGNLDGVVPSVFSEETYNQILNPPKALITVEGANHYSITNEDNPLREPNRSTLDQAVATETIARWSALFLRAHLLEDEGAFSYVYDIGDELDQNVAVISQLQDVVPDPISVIDFETAGDLLLVAGTVITNQFEGIEVSTPDTPYGAMIFDSAHPTGGDRDLLAPELGNVLIISEDGDSNDPDDNARGGTLRFEWDDQVNVVSLGLLDIEESGGSIQLFDESDQLIRSVDIPDSSDNSFQEVALGVSGVTQMDILFAGSGALTDIIFITDV